jgi:dTDP-4-amino-4,6-dideoxygalactose transaminase
MKVAAAEHDRYPAQWSYDVRAMTVPFLDLKAAYLDLKTELDAAFERVMNSGWYILGEETEAFEKEFAGHCGAKHCVGVGNGLDALILILRGYGIGPGDEVVVPANTYIASWLAVSYVGATPVPVEPDPETYNLDPDKIENALTSRARAIMPVHLYGQPAEMEKILAIGRRNGLTVIEDAAQAQGARSHGRHPGNFGEGAAGYSFYPTKNLGAYGDAGAIVTNDGDLADRVRVLRNYGSRTKYHNEVKGVNSRLDPLQAAFLRVKLKYLDDWNGRRKTIAQGYLKELAAIPNLKLPVVAENAEPSWHLFVVRHSRRDALQEHLKRAGIGSLVHYPIPPHLSGAYAEGKGKPGDYPITEEIAQTVLSLPIGPHLSAEAAAQVVRSLQEFEG